MLKRVDCPQIGRVYKVSTRYSRYPNADNGSAYPWGSRIDTVPIRILYEYRHYYVAEVLPHANPVCAWEVSKPYRITIDKFDIIKEWFKVYERGEECEELYNNGGI